MGKHIQIRDVPDELHTKLKKQAATDGISMSAYIMRLIMRDLSRPDWKTFHALGEGLDPLKLHPSPTEIIRQERDSR